MASRQSPNTSAGPGTINLTLSPRILSPCIVQSGPTSPQAWPRGRAQGGLVTAPGLLRRSASSSPQFQSPTETHTRPVAPAQAARPLLEITPAYGRKSLRQTRQQAQTSLAHE